ncbi:MAG: DUF4348 domain-containing protein [Bacteroidia bacterium]
MLECRILLVAHFLFVIGCTKSGNTESNAMQAITKEEIAQNVDLDFATFLNYFNQDSQFQISRVLFPLKIEKLNYDLEMIETSITEEEYSARQFPFSKIETKEIFQTYTQIITIESDTATIAIEGIENGLVANYHFLKLNGKWKLTSIFDPST